MLIVQQPKQNVNKDDINTNANNNLIEKATEEPDSITHKEFKRLEILKARKERRLEKKQLVKEATVS